VKSKPVFPWVSSCSENSPQPEPDTALHTLILLGEGDKLNLPYYRHGNINHAHAQSKQEDMHPLIDGLVLITWHWTNEKPGYLGGLKVCTKYFVHITSQVDQPKDTWREAYQWLPKALATVSSWEGPKNPSQDGCCKPFYTWTSVGSHENGNGFSPWLPHVRSRVIWLVAVSISWNTHFLTAIFPEQFKIAGSLCDQQLNVEHQQSRPETTPPEGN
jgi:hypothetical protein